MTMISLNIPNYHCLFFTLFHPVKYSKVKNSLDEKAGKEAGECGVVARTH